MNYSDGPKYNFWQVNKNILISIQTSLVFWRKWNLKNNVATFRSCSIQSRRFRCSLRLDCHVSTEKPCAKQSKNLIAKTGYVPFFLFYLDRYRYRHLSSPIWICPFCWLNVQLYFNAIKLKIKERNLTERSRLIYWLSVYNLNYGNPL